MDTQLRYVTKEELHKIIDEMPGDKLMVMTYEKDTGISDKGRMIKKKKAKVYVDKATIIVMTESKPVRKVDLEGNFFKLPYMNNNIIKTILLPQLE